MERLVVLLDDDSLTNMANEKILTQFYPQDNIKTFISPDAVVDLFKLMEKDGIIPKETIIFLDLHFPKHNGFEFMETLEHFDFDELFDPKIILLTANNSTFTQEKINVFPMVKQFIQKPLKKEHIKHRNLIPT